MRRRGPNESMFRLLKKSLRRRSKVYAPGTSSKRQYMRVTEQDIEPMISPLSVTMRPQGELVSRIGSGYGISTSTKTQRPPSGTLSILVSVDNSPMSSTRSSSDQAISSVYHPRAKRSIVWSLEPQAPVSRLSSMPSSWPKTLMRS